MRLLTLFIAGTVAAPLPAIAYEMPVHFAVTMWLADLRGFDEGKAFELAKYDQGVDDDPETQPLPDWNSAGSKRRSEYHFVNKERLEHLQKAALECSGEHVSAREFKQMGQFLHATEDVYSHRSYGPKLGHALSGHTPDKPWNNPAAFVTMVNAKFEKLGALLRKCAAAASEERIALAKFKQATEDLARWSETEYSFGVGDQGSELRWDALLR